MKSVLFDTSTHADHEDVLRFIAEDLFTKISKQCTRAARYGLKALSLDVTTLKIFKWVPKGCEDRVLSNLHTLLTREHLLRSSHGFIVDLSWVPLPGEQQMVQITTRDLIDVGIVDTTIYGDILRQLRTALAKREVYDTKQAQLVWVKERFKRNR